MIANGRGMTVTQIKTVSGWCEHAGEVQKTSAEAC